MAGVAKPSVSNLGAEITPTIIGSLSRVGNVSGLFDGTMVNEWNTNRVMYWEYSGHYVELDIPKCCNIWRSGTLEWKDQNFPLAIKKWNGTSYDDVTNLYNLPTTQIDNTKWEKFVQNLPAGRYRFERMDGYRIDSEWYIETAVTTKSLVKIGTELKTFKDGEFVTVSPQTEADWKAQGIENLNTLFTPISKVDKPMTEGATVGTGKLNSVPVDKSKYKILGMGVY